MADESRPAVSGGRGPIQPNLRLTFQATQRDKINVFWDEQISNNSLGAGFAPRTRPKPAAATTAGSACSR